MRALILTLVLCWPVSALADDTVHFTVTPPDGGPVTVIVGVAKPVLIMQSLLPPGATDEEYAAFVRDDAPQCDAPAVCEQMPDDWVPPYDRRLRNAWKKAAHKEAKGNFKDVDEVVRGIEIDMPKARKIWEKLIEQAAVDELRRDTIDVRVAEVRGDTKDIEVKKEKRDALFGIMETVTPTIESAQTPDELLAYWPAELPEATRPKTPTVEDKAKAKQQRDDIAADHRKKIEQFRKEREPK